MEAGIGHSELYKMGFDGAGIGLLRKLTPEQVKRLIEILEEFQQKSQIIRVSPSIMSENKPHIIS